MDVSTCGDVGGVVDVKVVGLLSPWNSIFFSRGDRFKCLGKKKGEQIQQTMGYCFGIRVGACSLSVRLVGGHNLAGWGGFGFLVGGLAS